MNLTVVTFQFPVRSETFVGQHLLAARKLGLNVRVVSSGIGTGIKPEEISQFEDEEINLETYRHGRFDTLKSIVSSPMFYLKSYFKNRSLRLCYNHAGSAAILATLKAAINKHPAHIIHSHHGACGLQTFEAVPERKQIVTWHGSDCNVALKARSLRSYEKLFKSGTLHTVNSNFLREQIIKLGSEPERTFVVPMGIDTNLFTPRSALATSTHLFNIVSIGRLDKDKGHNDLIDAIEILKSSQHKIHLKVIGAGPLHDALLAQVNSRGLKNEVSLLGAMTTNELLPILQNADLFALASTETADGSVESQGVVFAEAQACGIPVVGTNVGGIPESIEEGVTGRMCEPHKPEEIAKCISYFYHNRHALKHYKDSARIFAVKKFSRESMMNRFAELYRALADN